MSDYYKIITGNADTGAARRCRPVDSLLNDMVPWGSPIVNRQNLDTSTPPSNENAEDKEPTKKKRKTLDPIEQFKINKLSPDASPKSAEEIQIEKVKAKVDLFKSFHGRRPEESKEMLDLYKDFEV